MSVPTTASGGTPYSCWLTARTNSVPPPVTSGDRDVPAPELVDQLQHRLVHAAEQRTTECRVLGDRHERADPAGELLGRDALAQAGQGQGDAFQAELAHRGRVVAEDRVELRGVREVGLGRPGPQRVDEEVELHVARALAPEGAVVVEARDPLLRRHVEHVVEERHERLTGGPGAPGGEQVVRHGRPPRVPVRAVARSESRRGSCPCRSAAVAARQAGSAGSRCRRTGGSRP